MNDRKKSSWPFAIALVYGLFAAGMIGVVIFAVRHPSDLVSRDYYQKEIRYQQQIDSEKRAQKDADAPTIAIKGRECVIHFPGNPPASGTLTLYRPADAALDRTVPLALDGQQNQTLNLADAASGLWRLRMEWNRNGETYFKEQEVVVN